MTEASKTSAPQTSSAIPNITFSQALEGGLTHSDWLVGPTTDPYGQVLVLVSHSVSLEKVKEQKTNGTCGLHFAGSSPSADLQLCLESRLQVRLEGLGSPEYALTWKRWNMESGPQIYALRASVRRTSGKGFGGWPTPNTPNGGRKTPPGISTTGKTPDGKKRQVDLQHVARSIWGRATPAARDYRSESATDELNQARLNHPRGKPLSWQVAETANNAEYLLNPLFPLWLQGYPAEWAYCVVPEIQSILGLQPSLFKRM